MHGYEGYRLSYNWIMETENYSGGQSGRWQGEAVPANMLASYRQRGFVHVPEVLSTDEVAYYRDAAQKTAASTPPLSDRPVFMQLVNVWRCSDAMKQLTLHPLLGRLASELAGVPLRLWHDQILIKKPHNNAATEFHQDQPYWPHDGGTHAISAWIALVDVPVERGCMTFLTGSHGFNELRAQDLGDAHSLFGIAPSLEWYERVTVPLRAGDCTFHHARCAHMAGSNETDVSRVAHTIIYTDASTRFNGGSHVVTAPLALTVGAELDGEMFPQING